MADELTYAMIGQAMEVHRNLGPGLDERIYHELLSHKLNEAGLGHLSRPRRELVHRGITADVFEPDLVLPDRLILELKCLTGGFDGEHYVQIICYQKFWKIGVGLLLDFGKESLAYRRVQFSEPQFERPNLETMMPNGRVPPVTRETAFRLCETVRRVLDEPGLGYRDSTYTGLLLAELTASDLPCVSNLATEVRSGGLLLGQSACPCLVVGQKIGVRVLALRQNISAADIAILRTYLRLLKLDCGLILNFGRSSFDLRWVGLSSKSETSDE